MPVVASQFLNSLSAIEPQTLYIWTDLTLIKQALLLLQAALLKDHLSEILICYSEYFGKYSY